jgi:hypothetical protein
MSTGIFTGISSGISTVAVRRTAGGAVRRGQVELRQRTASRRPLPDALIIGTQRGGTTALFSYLSGHPDVRPPLIKECQFFSMHWQRGTDYYRAHFPTSEEPDGRRRWMTLDATPYYLFHPCAAERAHAVVPEARIIALLRDPVARAVSHYQHSAFRGFEPLPILAALEAEDKRLRGEADRLRREPGYSSWRHRTLSYTSRSRYSEQLPAWLSRWPRDQVLVLRSEDLFEAPVQSYAEVLRFLGLAPHRLPEYPRKNRAHRPVPVPEEALAFLREALSGEPAAVEELVGAPFRWPSLGAPQNGS